MFRKSGLLPRFILSISFVSFVTAMALAGQTAPGTIKKLDPCSLLTKEEIQEAVGQPVQAGKLNTMANASVGQPCEFKVGDYGVFSILVKNAQAGENAAAGMAQLKKMGQSCTEIAGLGDGSFSFAAGYGVLSLNTFKGSAYLIITMLVPGMGEAAQKACAEKLMRKALSKL